MRVSTYVSGMFMSNCYVAQDEGAGKAIIIDPGECSQELCEQIDRIGKENVVAILLTHCHFDHILGASKLRDYTGAPVMIHELDADGLCDPEKNGIDFFMLGDVAGLPKADKRLKSGETLEIGDLQLGVMHTPGHSPGSCCFFVGGTIFSGDTLFPSGCGRTDLPGGSSQELRESLRQLAALEGDYCVYPGHDAPTTLEFERKNNPYME